MKALIFILTLLFVLCSSCSFIARKGKWGKDAFYPIKSERVKNAFIKNATSAHVWVPTVGAGFIHVMAYDNKISKYVNKDRTIYNEQTKADNYSDNFNNALKYEMYLSILLTPSQNEEGKVNNYIWNKFRGALLVNAASSSSKITQHTIRGVTDRRRPNAKDNNSLPSGHATEAGSRRVLITRNLESSGMDQSTQTGINTVNTLMSFGTMWARVEGKRHYPTDVLLGYALGSFVSGFIYDALINDDMHTSVSLGPTPNGAMANFSYHF